MTRIIFLISNIEIIHIKSNHNNSVYTYIYLPIHLCIYVCIHIYAHLFRYICTYTVKNQTTNGSDHRDNRDINSTNRTKNSRRGNNKWLQ